MRKGLIGVIVVLLFCGSIAFGGEKVSHWEYAELHNEAGIAWLFNGGGVNEIASDEDSTKALNALGKKLGAKPPKGSALEPVMNAIGAKGWELVSSDGHSFIFKRPAQ